jgi:hypothetical protein
MATDQKPDVEKVERPMGLKTPHDVSLVVVGMEGRAEALDKLAKKNEEEGYTREAKSIAADAAAIRENVLPIMRRQLEIPFPKSEDVEKRIATELATLVRPAVINAPMHIDQKKTKEEQEEIFRDRADRLLDELASRILAYGEAIADDAYQAGLAAREATPTRFAANAVKGLGSG